MEDFPWRCLRRYFDARDDLRLCVLSSRCSARCLAPGAIGFRDPGTITQALKAGLVISIAIDVIAIGSGLLQLQLLHDFQARLYPTSTIYWTFAS
jgi:hypothetical protein